MSSSSAGDGQRVVVGIDDNQFKTSCSLCILGCKRRSHFQPPKGRHPTLKTLDWLSLFFVHGPRDDAAAMALKIDPPHVTLFVALDRGTPDAEDCATGTLLVDAIRNVLRTPGMSLQQKRDIFVELLLRRTPQCIQRKVHLLSTLVPPSSDTPLPATCAYLLKLISDWLVQGNQETSTRLVDWASRSSGHYRDASHALTECVIELWNISVHAPPNIFLFPSDTKGRLTSSMELYGRIIHRISLLLGSTFLVNKVKDEPIRWRHAAWEDWCFLKHVRRRLERIFCYETGADAFSERGVILVGNALQRTDARQGIWICWVGKGLSMPSGHGVQRFYPGTPQDILDVFFRRPELLFFGREWPHETERAIVALKQHFAEAWVAEDTSQGTTVTPHWHCELQLIVYLTEKQITVEGSGSGWPGDGLIGMSKLSCEMCHEFLETARTSSEDPPRRWTLSGTSGKPQYSWAIPEGRIGKRLVDKVEGETKDVLYSSILRHPELKNTSIAQMIGH